MEFYLVKLHGGPHDGEIWPRHMESKCARVMEGADNSWYVIYNQKKMDPVFVHYGFAFYEAEGSKRFKSRF